MAKLVALLRQDVVLEMPPFLTWFTGREPVVQFLADRCTNGTRMARVWANGQPAVVAYFRGNDPLDDRFHARTLHVLTVDGSGISRIVAYRDQAVIEKFGLPMALPSAAAR